MIPTTPRVGVQGEIGEQASGRNDALRGLDMDEFLKLMIAEMQNQDPLNPMENSEILQQISQIREIEATGDLSTTLDAVLLGQNLSSASSMIGKHVKALAGTGDNLTEVAGIVDRVSVADGKPTLHIGTQSFALQRVREITAPAGGSDE